MTTVKNTMADMSGLLTLKPAGIEDREFLRAVFFTTRADEFLNAGWRMSEIESLLSEQFSIQDRYYRRHYPDAFFDVVMMGDESVGRLYHHWGGREMRIIDIALLPQYRGNGIGTRLMRALVDRAARLGLSMRLYVELDNPVRTLYRRLGFESHGKNGLYDLMLRQPLPFDDGNPVPHIPRFQALLESQC